MDEPESEFRADYLEVKKAILARPGHADYFGENIKKIMDSEVAHIPSSSHPTQRYWYFETLQKLQDGDSVRVLGELLFDERNPWADGPAQYEESPNSLYAVESLHKIGLKNPPMPAKKHGYPGDLPVWQHWYEQIKNGSRTFSFLGDDRVYRLGDPTEDKKPAERESRRPPVESSQTGGVARDELPTHWIWWGVAAVSTAGVVFGVWRRFSTK